MDADADSEVDDGDALLDEDVPVPPVVEVPLPLVVLEEGVPVALALDDEVAVPPGPLEPLPVPVAEVELAVPVGEVAELLVPEDEVEEAEHVEPALVLPALEEVPVAEALEDVALALDVVLDEDVVPLVPEELEVPLELDGELVPEPELELVGSVLAEVDDGLPMLEDEESVVVVVVALPRDEGQWGTPPLPTFGSIQPGTVDVVVEEFSGGSLPVAVLDVGEAVRVGVLEGARVGAARVVVEADVELPVPLPAGGWGAGGPSPSPPKPSRLASMQPGRLAARATRPTATTRTRIALCSGCAQKRGPAGAGMS